MTYSLSINIAFFIGIFALPPARFTGAALSATLQHEGARKPVWQIAADFVYG